QRSVSQGEEPESIRVLPRALHGPALAHLEGGGQLATLFDLLPADTLVVLDGPSRLHERIDYFSGIVAKHWEELARRAGQEDEPPNIVKAGIPLEHWIIPSGEAERRLKGFQCLNLIDLLIEAEDLKVPRELQFTIGAQGFDGIAPNFKDFVEL